MIFTVSLISVVKFFPKSIISEVLTKTILSTVITCCLGRGLSSRTVLDKSLKEERGKEGKKTNSIWTAVLVIANRSGGARRGNERENGEGDRGVSGSVSEREGARSGKGGGRRGESRSYGSRYRAE